LEKGATQRSIKRDDSVHVARNLGKNRKHHKKKVGQGRLPAVTKRKGLSPNSAEELLPGKGLGEGEGEVSRHGVRAAAAHSIFSIKPSGPRRVRREKKETKHAGCRATQRMPSMPFSVPRTDPEKGSFQERSRLKRGGRDKLGKD